MPTLVCLLLLLLAPAVAAGPLDAPGATSALACSACHGLGGQSPSNTMPILAGIAPWYFKKAIHAKQVLQLGVDEIAAYFAGQARTPSPVKLDAAAVERGRAAAAQCTVCHGASGKGDASKGVPDLTGQPPGYLRNQMLLFKADRRSPGDDTIKAVKALMKTIPDEQFADLAAYWSSVR